MSIFKDLGFKKRSGSGEIVSPDAVRFNGKTYEEIINELGNSPSPVLSPDVDGTISVDGNNLIGTVEYLTHPGVVGANGIYYSGDYTASNVAIKGFLPDTGVYIVNLYYSSVSGTATFDLVMSDNDADVESNLYYLSPLFRFFPVSIGAISVEVDTNNGTITIDGTSISYDKNKTSLIFGNDNANSSYEVSISGNLPASGGDVTINQESEQGNWVQYKAEATNIDGDLYINGKVQEVESTTDAWTTYNIGDRTAYSTDNIKIKFTIDNVEYGLQYVIDGRVEGGGDTSASYAYISGNKLIFANADIVKLDGIVIESNTETLIPGQEYILEISNSTPTQWYIGDDYPRTADYPTVSGTYEVNEGIKTVYTTQTTDTDQLTVSTDGTVDSVDINVWVAE